MQEAHLDTDGCQRGRFNTHEQNLHIMHIAERCLHGFRHMPVIGCYFYAYQFVFTVIATLDSTSL